MNDPQTEPAPQLHIAPADPASASEALVLPPAMVAALIEVGGLSIQIGAGHHARTDAPDAEGIAALRNQVSELEGLLRARDERAAGLKALTRDVRALQRRGALCHHAQIWSEGAAPAPCTMRIADGQDGTCGYPDCPHRRPRVSSDPPPRLPGAASLPETA